jgi:hypothetical protein
MMLPRPFAKLVRLVFLAAVWLIVAAVLLFFTMPFWGMHPQGIVVTFVREAMILAFLIWLGSYVAVAVATLRGK